MTKKKEVAPEKAPVEAPVSDLEARWAAFLDRYEKQNPEKFAVKKARGELDRVPESFV